MKIDKLQSYITPKTTGYSAVTAMGITALSGISKNKSIKKLHKPFAVVSIGFTALHVGLIEYYHYKYKSAR